MVAKRRWTNAAIITFGVTLIALIRWQEQSALAAALASYRHESHEHAQAVASTLESSFNTIYSGLRTMARLPGVRGIDRYARNFSSDARTTVQELYNNLASSVSLSEVYIVPRDLDPDRIDPVTHELEIPITTFDALIVGRTAEHRTHDHDHDHDHDSDSEDGTVPEIEIFEYRLMRQQLARLVHDYENEGRVDGAWKSIHSHWSVCAT